MFAAERGELVDAGELGAAIASTPGIEGLSVLGGEPFQQAGALAEVCRLVRRAGLSVMVYSGYTLEELEAQRAPEVGELLGLVDLLADGRFEQAKAERTRRWLGSTNQRLHFLTARYSPTDARFLMPNTVELRYVDGQLTINGWPTTADAFRPR
jgi:anaerobic ribonucleoside-triphosphate reductase activating protein